MCICILCNDKINLNEDTDIFVDEFNFKKVHTVHSECLREHESNILDAIDEQKTREWLYYDL